MIFTLSIIFSLFHIYGILRSLFPEALPEEYFNRRDFIDSCPTTSLEQVLRVLRSRHDLSRGQRECKPSVGVVLIADVSAAGTERGKAKAKKKSDSRTAGRFGQRPDHGVSTGRDGALTLVTPSATHASTSYGSEIPTVSSASTPPWSVPISTVSQGGKLWAKAMLWACNSVNRKGITSCLDCVREDSFTANDVLPCTYVVS